MSLKVIIPVILSILGGVLGIFLGLKLRKQQERSLVKYEGDKEKEYDDEDEEEEEKEKEAPGAILYIRWFLIGFISVLIASVIIIIQIDRFMSL